MQRKIVTLCGSTRFYRAFQEANYRETMAGNIVLSIGCDTKSDDGLAITDEQKRALDELHFDKIAMSDEILVLNVDRYVGESTRNEIAYALLKNIPIRWLEGGDEWLVENAHELGRRVAAHVEAGR